MSGENRIWSSLRALWTRLRPGIQTSDGNDHGNKSPKGAATNSGNAEWDPAETAEIFHRFEQDDLAAMEERGDRIEALRRRDVWYIPLEEMLAHPHDYKHYFPEFSDNPKMTEQQLREALAKSLRKLDPESELLQLFWAALLYRREHAGLHEAEPNPEGLTFALQRALAVSLYDWGTMGDGTKRLPRVNPNPDLPTELANAAGLVPTTALAALISRRARRGNPLTEANIDELVQSALRAYANSAEGDL